MTRLIASSTPALLLGAAMLLPVCGWTESQDSTDALKAGAAQLAAQIRGSRAYKQGGCDIDALLGSVIARSREPLLREADQIVSVNGHDVRPSESIFDLVNLLPPTATVTLRIIRKQVYSTIKVQCLNSAESLAIIVAAYEAAAKGQFFECATNAEEYEKKYVRRSSIYGLWRRCGIAAGFITDEQLYTTYLTYWTLKFREVKYFPDQIDEIRAAYLGAETLFLNSGQTLLLNELQRQWALTTGDPSKTVPTPHTEASLSPTPAFSDHIILHASRESCEGGHWIEAVMGDGAIIKLEDGSLWQVSAVDAVTTALWLPTASIVTCGGKLINTDDNESTDAQRIQ